MPATREVRAAERPRSRYPRLAAAWRLLVGAAPIALGGGVAHADLATPDAAAAKAPVPPRSGSTSTQKSATDQRADEPLMRGPLRPFVPLKAPKVDFKKVDTGEVKEHPAPPAPKKKPEYPPFQGVMGRRATPPDVHFIIARDGDAAADPDAIELHPHAPDEPCRKGLL